MRAAILAVLLCALFAVPVEARPNTQTGYDRTQSGYSCSDPVMKPCRGELKIERSSQRIGKPHKGRYRRLQATGGRPRAWCGWWLGRHLGMLDRKLWLARNWAHVGRPAHGPHVGAIVIFARGKRGGHVGIITGKTDRGWTVLSGNDGHAVRERVRSVSNAIAFRWP